MTPPTLSALVKNASDGNAGFIAFCKGNDRSKLAYVNNGDGLYRVTFTIPDDVDETFSLELAKYAEKTLTFEAAKLEFGSESTLAHKEGDTWVLNDPPPNPALELAKCQRYFARIAPGTIEGTCSMPLGSTNIGATEHINFLTVVPVPMRAIPTMKYKKFVLVDMTANTRTNLPDDGIVTIADCSAGNVHVNIRFEGWNLDNTHIYRIFVNAGGFLEFSSDL